MFLILSCILMPERIKIGHKFIRKKGGQAVYIATGICRMGAEPCHNAFLLPKQCLRIRRKYFKMQESDHYSSSLSSLTRLSEQQQLNSRLTRIEYALIFNSSSALFAFQYKKTYSNRNHRSFNTLQKCSDNSNIDANHPRVSLCY